MTLRLAGGAGQPVGRAGKSKIKNQKICNHKSKVLGVERSAFRV
jgi:hypothetical protein